MKNILIENYINKMTREDIAKFALKNNISLDSDELNYIYNKIKKDWKHLLYADSNLIINEIKSNLSIDKQNKVILLYEEYYKKYKSYL